MLPVLVAQSIHVIVLQKYANCLNRDGVSVEHICFNNAKMQLFRQDFRLDLSVYVQAYTNSLTIQTRFDRK